MEIENTQLTLALLEEIRNRVITKELDEKDLMLLDGFLSDRGIPNYLSEKLRENGFTYHSYILERKKENSPRKELIEGQLKGIILGIIDILKRIAPQI